MSCLKDANDIPLEEAGPCEQLHKSTAELAHVVVSTVNHKKIIYSSTSHETCFAWGVSSMAFFGVFMYAVAVMNP